MQTEVTSMRTSEKYCVYDLSHKELIGLLEELGQPKFRTKQIEEWLWQRGAQSFDEMTNLPKTLREKLGTVARVCVVEEIARQLSSDGTRKYLLKLFDGARVECVGMPSGEKLAVCVSTQAGCAMGCAFCATGKLGFARSLTTAEIYSQVTHVMRDFGQRVSSVVLMGQGEPFLNYEAVLAAMRRMNADAGLGIGARHITVSTCGILPAIARFANEPEQFTLAMSLHSANQKTRDYLMPGVKQFSLLRLYDVMGTYCDKTGRRPSYEYALIAGVNDTADELEALCDFCRGTLAHVNIIMLNEVNGSPFKPASEARADDFVRALARVGVEATVRKSRGADIDAACGQLHLKSR